MKTNISKIACAMTLMATCHIAYAAAEKPTLVLVHGAHFTDSSWSGLQQTMQPDWKTYAIDLPGRNDKLLPHTVSLDVSAAALCKSLGGIKGEKILVAHSQGGAVVNAALAICPDEELAKIVYLTAVSPMNDTSPFELLSEKDEQGYFSGIHYNKEIKLLEISDKQKFADSFAQDASKSQQQELILNAVSEPSPIGGTKVTLNRTRFKQIDKYYIYAQKDLVISYESQKKIAKTMELKGEYTLDSGHLPMLTKTKELAKILNEIAKS